ncbi:MAG: amidohydrolase family protein [Cyclobacteriaceae bacterium]|nr:amidohydrolase family protein [Cyclobacteriaceae bacterium]
MKRRKFLQAGSAVATLPFWFPAASHAAGGWQGPLAVVLRGGRSYLEGRWQTPDVGITGEGKIHLGAPGSMTGAEIVDVSGKVVAPGFIDVLADNAANPERTYRIFEKYKVSDGVTTALQMHGGTPDCAAYYLKFGNMPHYINFGLSTFVMRIRLRTSSLTERQRQVEKTLEEGILGVSHSLEYQPNTSYEEVLSYARLAKKYQRPFFLHLRYSSEQDELKGVDEAIRIARESGAHVHIDHLHSTGGTYHMAEALNRIRTANASGLSMTCCVYPYSYWATYLSSARYGEGWQQRYNLTYSDLRLVGTGERLTKESFARYKGMSKLAAVPEGTLPLDKTVDLALREEFCMIGSDGGIEYEPNANSHPRGAGCFSTAIRHMLDIGMPLEKALEKVTLLPRNLVMPAMKDRGILAEGQVADIVVLDPVVIKGKASVENPNQFSDGISRVYVNGKLAYTPGKLGSAAGVGIRYR